jgi:hypothetical protein
MGFIAVLDSFADYRDISRPSLTEATIAVTERYARRQLQLKKKDALVYRGLQLRCIGSKRWRQQRG